MSHLLVGFEPRRFQDGTSITSFAVNPIKAYLVHGQGLLTTKHATNLAGMNLKVPVWKQCLIILGLCISWTSAAAPWEAIDFPNPYSESQACGRGDVKSWICDPDGILSVREANVVEGMLKDIALARDPYPKSECGTDDIPGFQVCSLYSTYCCVSVGLYLAPFYGGHHISCTRKNTGEIGGLNPCT